MKSLVKHLTLFVGLLLIPIGYLIHSEVVGNGQTVPNFDSESDGSDGPLVISTPSVDPEGYLFDPRDPSTFDPDGNNGRAMLDPDRDGVYHFTEILIGVGVTVRLSAVPLGTTPVIWLSEGPIVIDGTLDLNGEDGHLFDAAIRVPSIAGAGGSSGGVGGDNADTQRGFPSQPGAGPGGGGVNPTPGGCGTSAGHAFNVQSNACGVGPRLGFAYGNEFLLPLIGGSGGGGMWGNSTSSGAGAGGGALLLASSESVSIDGVVSADGGIGGTLSSGGGSGGAIRLVGPVVAGNGSLLARGGDAGHGGSGSVGRIRVETYDSQFEGVTDPPARTSNPGLLFSPNPLPIVRVVSVDGTGLPSNPIGDPQVPDAQIDEDGDTVIAIEGNNIPVGTIVRLNMQSDNGPPMIVESSPLAGTFGSSTATASVQLPPGLSRFSVMATWDPDGGG